MAAVILLLPALLAMGCGFRGLRRSTVAPEAIGALPRNHTTLKAHLHDGGVIVFGTWSFDEAARVVRGTGRRLDPARDEVGVPELAVALDSVALFESDVITVPGPMVGITLLVAVHAAATAVCAALPKVCFGSCPTFYAWDGQGQSMMAEGFSASVAPALEATDLDALDRVRVSGRSFTLIMTNEALETHVVRRADLLVAARPPGARVLSDVAGSMWATRDGRAPDRATGPEGDCRAALAARDMDERSSLADSTDLSARETLDLTFRAAGPGPYGVVIVARQSLLSTYLFYQSLAWMGRSAGAWLASLEAADAGPQGRAGAVARLLGNIELQVEREGGWSTVGEFHETGPLAADSRVVPLPGTEAGERRVRLRMTRGLWRLDQVALVALGSRVEPARVRPSGVVRRGRADARALASLRGEAAPLVTQPGDTLEIVYELPIDGQAADVFLESRGYYLEWMREAWLAEENPGRLMQLFLDPAAALREMAPEFKKVEPGMERAFWGSRYGH